MRKNAARSEKTSHAGIIRIGFEGISQPHYAWSTPVSITRLKHHGPANGKWELALADGLSPGRFRRREMGSCDSRRTGWPRQQRLAGHCGDSRAGEHGEHGLLGPYPNRMRGAARFSWAGPALSETNVKADGAVDGLNHLTHRRRNAARRDAKPARLSAPRSKKPGARQGLQNLGEKALRSARSLGQRGKRDALAGRRRGQLNHHADAVIGSARQLHRRIRSLHRVVQSNLSLVRPRAAGSNASGCPWTHEIIRAANGQRNRVLPQEYVFRVTGQWPWRNTNGRLPVQIGEK